MAHFLKERFIHFLVCSFLYCFFKARGTLLASVQTLPCKRVFYVCMCRNTLDTLQRLRLSNRGTACYFGHLFPFFTWYPERSVTKLLTALWTWIALRVQVWGTNVYFARRPGTAPPPPPVVGEVYIWIFTRFVATAQTLTNLVGSRFSILQPPQILALPPCACPIPPGPRGPSLIPAEQEPEGSVEPGASGPR